jgi:hypothetical protein
MVSRLCDVVGCGQIAYWRRVSDVHVQNEAHLCQRCWANLCAHSTYEARAYAPSDDPEGAAFAFSSGTRPLAGSYTSDTDETVIG